MSGYNPGPAPPPVAQAVIVQPQVAVPVAQPVQGVPVAQPIGAPPVKAHAVAVPVGYPTGGASGYPTGGAQQGLHAVGPPLPSPCCGTDDRIRPEYGYAPNPRITCCYSNPNDPRWVVNAVDMCGCPKAGIANLATTKGKLYLGSVLAAVAVLLAIRVILQMVFKESEEESPEYKYDTDS